VRLLHNDPHPWNVLVAEPIIRELYEFAILLWMSNQAATGDQTLLPTYRRAHRHLLRAPAVLTNIEQLLARAAG
jgi:hypothetical protein